MWNCFERSDCIRIDTECWNVFKNLSCQIYKVLFRVQLPLIDDYYYKNENEKKKNGCKAQEFRIANELEIWPLQQRNENKKCVPS